LPCYYPRNCAQSKTENVISKDGKRKREFIYGVKVSQGSPLSKNFEATQVPCGRCIGCRLERSRQDAVRSCHEASLYEDNCFITLTYSDEFVPVNGSLVKSHFQDFMKDLRSYVSYRCASLHSDGQTMCASSRIRFLA